MEQAQRLLSLDGLQPHELSFEERARLAEANAKVAVALQRLDLLAAQKKTELEKGKARSWY